MKTRFLIIFTIGMSIITLFVALFSFGEYFPGLILGGFILEALGYV